MMQTSCRPSKKLTIGVKSNQCKRKCEITFSKVHYFFFINLQQKQNRFLKACKENFKLGGVTKLKEMIFM